MEKQIYINNKSITYTDEGQGQTLVLLHGYLETKEVWTRFAKKLSKTFRVITIDLPGHGKSDVIAKTHSMNLMAETVNNLLLELNIEICTIIGHSMGGYVLLAFAQLFPQKLNRLVLFHSSVYSDTDEKKKNRLREIEFIQQGKLDLIVNSNLPDTFANENHILFSQTIETMKAMAVKSNPEGVCSILRGMMERNDQQEMIKNFKKPMLFIFGRKDNYIPVEVGEKMEKINNKIQLKWLTNSGHMGFVEEEKVSLRVLKRFLLIQQS